MTNYVDFRAEVTKSKETGSGSWNVLEVGVFGKKESDVWEKVGEYGRNYHSLMDTFYPFKQKDKWYALYSKDYTSTRVMSLPDCKDLGGEKSDSFGFCPVEYYVPWDPESDEEAESIVAWEDIYRKDKEWEGETRLGTFGFVSGCVWGDDSSWKIEYLDLSQVEKGIIVRDDRFGYQELPRKLSLKQCISLENCTPIDQDIEIATKQHFRLDVKPIVCENKSLPFFLKGDAFKEVHYNKNTSMFFFEFGDKKRLSISLSSLKWVSPELKKAARRYGYIKDVEIEKGGKKIILTVGNHTKSGPTETKVQIESKRFLEQT